MIHFCKNREFYYFSQFSDDDAGFSTFAAMQKKFISNLWLLLFLNLLIKPFWILGVDRSVQNLVGFGEYGFYTTILNFSFLFNILLDFGITNYNNRNIAQYQHLLSKHFSNILVLRFILAAIYFVVIMLTGIILGYDKRQMNLLAIVGFNQFLLALILYLRSNISGLLMFRTDSILSVLDRFLMIIFVGYLLLNQHFKLHFRIEWFVYTQTLAYIITCIIALIIVWKKAGKIKLHWNFPFLVMIIKQSIPFAILTLLMSTYNRIDPVILERLIPDPQGNYQVGIYAAAYRLLDAFNMVAYLFSVFLLPTFAALIKQKGNILPFIKFSFSTLFVFSILIAFTALYYSSELMTLMYPQHSDESSIEFQTRLNQSSLVFTLLMFAFISISSSYVFGTLLTANGNLKHLNIIAAMCVVINLSINLLLIPHIMATGSAIASLSAQTFSTMAQIVVVIKIFKIKTDKRYLSALLIFTIIALLSGFIIKQIGISWIQGICIIWIIGLISAISLKLINVNLLVKTLTEKSDNI